MQVFPVGMGEGQLGEDLLFKVAGYLGVAAYLGAYALLQMGVIKGNGFAYAQMNLAGASLILISLIAEWNQFSAIVQISFIVLSVAGMIRVWFASRRLRFSSEEQALLDARFATLHKLEARKLLDHGEWHDTGPGDYLTEEGQPVEAVCYLMSGGVDILIGGSVIAQVAEGNFVGEMAVMSGDAASASVVVNQPTRVFAMRSERLAQLIKRNPDISPHIEYAFARDTKAKLAETNVLLRMALDGSKEQRVVV